MVDNYTDKKQDKKEETMSTEFLVTIKDLTSFTEDKDWLPVSEYCWLTPSGNMIKVNIGEYGAISEIRLLTSLT
jgi:hypothetical protein